MSRSLRPRAASMALALGACSALVASAPAFAGPADQRVETPIVSSSPQTDVVSSVVRLHVPMLPSAAAHVAACDWISYQRWRGTDGPSNPMDADSVAVLFPGVIEGATAFDALARNAIRESARRGRHIEVWGIDRRSNCLEDHAGLDTAEASGNVQDAIDYYYGGKPIDGKKFAGFDVPDRVLADMSMEQTVTDYNAVLTNELPSQPWREQHVICGGHSMGGPLTEIYAGWDFDGDKTTDADAGYRQCAGFIGLDTTLNSGSLDLLNPPTTGLIGSFTGGLLKSVSNTTISAIKVGVIPRHVDMFGINPESMNALEVIASEAEKHPNDEATPLVKAVPADKHMEDFFRVAGSPDLASWALNKANLRNYRYTNMALLGQVMDDNGGVFGLVRTSFGFFDGAPWRLNRLPAQAGIVPGLGQLATPGMLVIPFAQNPQQLSTWRNYDDLPAKAKGITTPAAEVADATQFARAIHEGPLNLTENYFPIRLVADELLLATGTRSGGFAHAFYPHATLNKPRIAVIAGDGILGASSKPVDPRVIAPGYQHLDVLAAAENQNNGQPELSSQTLSNLIDTAVPR
jgi:hypothetical protein